MEWETPPRNLDASRSAYGTESVAGTMRGQIIESQLPVTVTERDFIAIGCNEEEVPTLEACTRVLAAQDQFCRALEWSGAGEEAEK
eukprot:3431109-Karenia_brevis.AAC.1